MEIQNLPTFNTQEIIAIVFKILAIIFSAFYLIYAFVISKQTEVMNKALEAKNNSVFFIISSAQITIGLILIILAIVLV